jgi:hypothetical protein
MSEHDEEQDPMAPPPREPAADEPADTPPAGPPAPEPYTPPAVELAEPGIYVCDEADPGIHPVLGQLVSGENDFTQTTDPAALAALYRLVESGTLTRKDGPSHESRDA